MALSQRQKQVVIEALLRSASDAGIEERQHRTQLTALLLRSQDDQQVEVIRAVNELRSKYEDNLAGLDAAIVLQRTQLTDAIAELDAILAALKV
jgi:hypothetical protein